ncbi:MAG: hypothetical protein EPO11_04800 [Gammaproteobacteria bacterium]|nr:MAG: hypothetical protein EPO11_04800 [Gammaproteobacteria bacterium]
MKKEPLVSVQPRPFQWNEAEVRDVIHIIRGNNNTRDNCSRCVEALLNYFETGIKPIEAASCTGADKSFLTTYRTSFLMPLLQIKKEPEGNPDELRYITQSSVDRHGIFGKRFPLGVEWPKTINVEKMPLQLKPIFNVDEYDQPHCHYTKLDDKLKSVAAHHGGTSFGIINLGLCGEKYVDGDGHSLVYYATTDKVVYIDVQMIDGEDPTKSLNPLTNDIASFYEFAGHDKVENLTENTFGPEVFYCHIGPHQPKLSEQFLILKEQSSRSQQHSLFASQPEHSTELNNNNNNSFRL